MEGGADLSHLARIIKMGDVLQHPIPFDTTQSNEQHDFSPLTDTVAAPCTTIQDQGRGATEWIMAPPLVSQRGDMYTKPQPWTPFLPANDVPDFYILPLEWLQPCIPENRVNEREKHEPVEPDGKSKKRALSKKKAQDITQLNIKKQNSKIVEI